MNQPMEADRGCACTQIAAVFDGRADIKEVVIQVISAKLNQVKTRRI
jgi:hypothetical protein